LSEIGAMLKRLYISNFALINEMDVTFPGQLSVITGETGAGKSIFLEALGLVLGKRADVASLRDKSRKCIIEAEFSTAGLELKDFFEKEAIDADDQIILRREINSEGKSRSFLNDTPVSLAALKFLSEKLIDIHSQHHTLLLNQSNFQLEILDAFAGSLGLFKEYKKDFAHLNKLRASLDELLEKEASSKKELDYFQFLYAELEETEIKTGRLASWEEESATLENAELIKSSLAAAGAVIGGGDENLLSALSKVRASLNGLSKFGKNYQQYYERLNSAYIELKELSSEIEDAANDIVHDAEALDELNAKIDKTQRLFKKHQVNNEEQLLIVKQDIETKLQGILSLDSQIATHKASIEKMHKQCVQTASELSAKRKAAISNIQAEVTRVLKDLAMPNGTFCIELKELEEIAGNGLDHVKFMFSANKGVALSELQKVASGGELSRLMLTLKSLLAEKKELPTIIFDEIDTGVSGDVADKIGNILSKMGARMQVITITHLPQIASKGEHHLFVYKKDDEEQTSSYIKELSKQERVSEIAKMLSTGSPSASALKNAKELLSSN
jgi:DNA repair protein RecN (Recombination protein N)